MRLESQGKKFPAGGCLEVSRLIFGTPLLGFFEKVAVVVF